MASMIHKISKQDLKTEEFHLRHIDLAVGPLGGSHDFGAELELEALLLQDALEVLGHLHVDAHPSYMAQELHCRDFSAQTLPH